MEQEQASRKDASGRHHLARLRDFLDLPLNALRDDGLTFTLAEGYGALACAGGGRLTLVCELAPLDALGDGDWRMLASRLSTAYDPAFPVSLATVEQQLALIWCGSADEDADTWLRKAEDALTFSLEMQAVLNGRDIVACLHEGAEE